jgi:acetyl-CoA carboxylase biotin carboxyl carrier protein
MSFKIDEAAIRKLAKLLDETNLTEIEISGEQGGNLRVQRAAPQMIAAAGPAVAHAAPVAAAAAPVAAVKAEDLPGVVKSPMVGTVYMAGAPGNPPFVEIGKQVTKGDTLLIIEAMKVMNPIKAPATGKITQIFVGDAKPVEFGEALVVIE